MRRDQQARADLTKIAFTAQDVGDDDTVLLARLLISTTVPAVRRGVRCWACGEELRPHETHCPGCGQKLER